MTLVEGMDYVVRVVPFPVDGSDGFIMSHPDVPCIYINSKICPDRQRRALQHELIHLMRDDLYSADSVSEIEGRMPV